MAVPAGRAITGVLAGIILSMTAEQEDGGVTIHIAIRQASSRVLAVLLVAGATLGPFPDPAHADSPTVTTSQVFEHTAAPQTFVVPLGVTTITVNAYGAQGGGSGGHGGHAQATIPVTPGEILEVNVGEKGGEPTTGLGCGVFPPAPPAPGGFNGGGASRSTVLGSSGGGGGASDVRQGGSGLASRVIVAGGGGGGSGGGGGGGLAGRSGVDGFSLLGPFGSGRGGQGGSQTQGGFGGAGVPGSTSPTGGVGVQPDVSLRVRLDVSLGVQPDV